MQCDKSLFGHGGLKNKGKFHVKFDEFRCLY